MLFRSQRLHAEINLRDARYDVLGFLNNQPYNFNGSWNWVAGHDLSGQIAHSASRSASNYSGVQAQVRSIYTSWQDSASLRYQIHPDWFVETVTSTSRSEQSLFSESNLRLTQSEAAVLYLAPSGSQAALRWSQRQGDYPNRQAGPEIGRAHV